MKDEIVAIHLLLHLMNYNYLAARNYAKKWPREIKDKHLFSLIWRVCKAVGQKAYKDLPEIIGKIANNEKYVPIAKAISDWHSKRMWAYVENGYESISMEMLQKLGISGVLADEIKARGYAVKEGFVYPVRQPKEKGAISTKKELDAIIDTMKSLESL